MPIPRLFLILLFLLTAISNSFAANPFEEGNKLVKTTIVQDRNEFQPSNSESTPAGFIGIKFEIEPGWHIYWANSGESGQPTALNWVVPESWRVGDILWPAPTKFIERGNIITYGYEGSVLLAVPIFNPSEIPNAPAQIEVQASSSWLVCKDICVPGQRDQKTNLTFSTDKALTPSKSAEEFKLVKQSALQPVPPGFNISFDMIAGAIVLAPPFSANISLEEVTNSLQYFPFDSPHLTFSQAILRTVGKQVQVLIPLSRIGKAPSASIEVGGILVTAPKILNNETETSYQVNFSLTAAELEGLSGKNETASGAPLHYRELHHDQDVAKKESVANVEVLQETKTPQSAGLGLSLLLAFLAGIILNVMPCVLPVLSIKVISLSLHRELTRADRIKYALTYLAGIEATFIVLAIIVATLRSIGMEVGWGFQFQQPAFVYSLSIVVFAFSLGFFDYYFVTIPGTQLLDSKITRLKSPAIKSFGEGILITLLSTPCTAPFLGTALAFAFSQSTFIATLIFIAIGFGLALPYLLVAAIPALADRIPRPGHWMRSIKELMGFLLLGTVIWLLYVLDALSPGSGLTSLAVLLWLAFIIWCARHFGKSGSSKLLKLILIFLLILVPAAYFRPTMPAVKAVATQNLTETEWRPYTADVAKALLAQNRFVFLDFTADWCITCKFNERVSLADSSVKETLARLAFTPLKADWTDGSKEITDALESYGGHGVPLYVMLSPDGRIEVLPTILTPGLVIERAEAFVKNAK
jgi:thiol:disulfide interchange protein